MSNDDSPDVSRYQAAVAARRSAQDTRDALGGYVDRDHPDHADNSSPQRRKAIIAADAALQLAVEEMNEAFAAHRRLS